MKILILITHFSLLSILCFGQCRLLTETGNYDALCFKELDQDNSTERDGMERLSRGIFGARVSISIAKKNHYGYFIVKIWGQRFNQNGKMQGDVILFLDDESIIKLIDRNVSWNVNGEVFGQYNLTSEEITKLKKSNIYAIRFWNCGNTVPCNKSVEYYNLDIKYTTDIPPIAGGGESVHVIERVDFPELITILYE